MLKLTTAICVAFLTASPSSAGILGVTPDGTWDCPDNSGTYLGAIVLADETYAFIKPDGLFGGYGKLFKNTTDLDLPNFAVIDGPLKDEMKAPAMALLGPKENTLDYTGDLFLYLVIDDTTELQCIRRVRPDA